MICIENRSSADNNQSLTGNSNSNFLPSYSSSADTSQIWTPIDSLNSSFSSTSSNYEYDSVSSSLYGSESKPNISLTTTTTTITDNASMIYNPNHRTIKEEEEHNIKRELLPHLNGTPPQKKKIKIDNLSTLSTPPSSNDYSSAAARMMVKILNSL